MHVNLLPPDWVWRQQLKRLLQPWLRLTFALASLLLIANLPLLFQWVTQLSTNRELSAMMRPVQALREQLEVTSQKVTQRQVKLNQLQRSVIPDVTSNLLGLVATAVAEQQLKVQIKDLRMATRQLHSSEATDTRSRTRAAGSNPSGALAMGAKRNGDRLPATAVSVRMTGQATDADQVARLIEALQQVGVFASVRLPALRERTVEAELMHEFELECDTYE